MLNTNVCNAWRQQQNHLFTQAFHTVYMLRNTANALQKNKTKQKTQDCIRLNVILNKEAVSYFSKYKIPKVPVVAVENARTCMLHFLQEDQFCMLTSFEI